MTASAGLHNMPADMRGAVVAEPGHVFVRADLGQIEPRVLAAVSGDAALAQATLDDDMYAPVARAARRRSRDREGRGARRDVRADDRSRRPGAARARLRVPGCDGLPQRGRPRRPARPRAAHLRRPADPDGIDRRRTARHRSRRARSRRGARSLRPQRDGAGRGGRAVQGLGGDRAGARRARSTRGSCCASTTSCSCTRRSSTATRSPGSSTTACRRPRTAGRPTTRSGSSPTSACIHRWSDAHH